MTDVGDDSGSAGSPGFERSKRRGDGILAASFKRAASTMCSMTSEADAAITKSSDANVVSKLHVLGNRITWLLNPHAIALLPLSLQSQNCAVSPSSA